MKRLAVLAAACAIALPVHAQNVATVNGQPITQKSLDQFVALLVEQGAQDTPELRTQVKQEMVNRLVAVQAAEKAGLDKQPAVKQEIELARQGILVRALMADYLKKNQITDAKIQAEYDKIKASQADKQEYKVRHILVKEEKAAEDLIAAIKAKKVTFDAAAKKDSIDPGSGKNGGDLGWAPSSNYVPEFGKAVEGLKKGQMTDKPVQSQFGWHIIQLDDSRAAKFPELADVKPQLEEMMRQQQLAEFQDKLIKDAKIQ
ncbi:peptidylprolyl isomerase [Parapusillimonas granuli]|uniref:peptidylprolyl isomerase n=1 Tax=Parapusillimonas granuli TaxID=380911 RepID=A0A853FZU4_9BURK|nr:peptidylprolyl isomerase [Parapusillimonas granuli]MBB5216732.1 peptidyl-prolyl cis-trans isomerase C [Parapusillimonas granuli]MEB2400061.1 peptidylprolyl isomerase [Alcaligenaceae bacterium]NYT51624.1 peptidylprolyl isomerase [Parapusillimonas granuli]